jgi:catechol 2,3-dioxygenase-like lactoylglutathione lyase family enzyme
MTVQFEQVIPILRIFSIEKAGEFYVGFLGFKVDWQHKFDEAAPVYMQVSRGTMLLHLTEHHGDCCPGSTVHVEMRGLADYHREVNAKGYGFMRPGIEPMPWGADVMQVTDPFGNRIRFTERRDQASVQA